MGSTSPRHVSVDVGGRVALGWLGRLVTLYQVTTDNCPAIQIFLDRNKHYGLISTDPHPSYRPNGLVGASHPTFSASLAAAAPSSVGRAALAPPKLLPTSSLVLSSLLPPQEAASLALEAMDAAEVAVDRVSASRPPASSLPPLAAKLMKVSRGSTV